MSPTAAFQAPLRMRIREIAAVRVRYGYQRILNRKRVYRLYKLEGLNLRRKRPRRHVSAAHQERIPPKRQ
jgi:putative transposase